MKATYFNLLAASLDDASSTLQVRKEILNKIDGEQLYNKLKGKDFFQAVVLTGGSEAEQLLGTYYPIKIRPLDIHESILPDPCSEKYKDDPAGAKRLIEMHPTAYADKAYTAGNRTPAFGETIQCFFSIDNPNQNGKMMGLRYKPPTGPTNYNFECANQELASLIGIYTSIPGELLESMPTPPPSSPILNRGDPGPPPNPLPSSAMNGNLIAKFEADLGAALKAKGLPFKVTDRSRTVSQQMQRIMSKYKRKGAKEVIGTYGKNRGRKMVAAIQSNNTAEFRRLASKSSRHLKGAAIDIRVWHYTDAQMPEVLSTIRSLGGNPLVEPMTGGCWDKPGRNLTHPKRPYGISTKRCNNQHIHIDIPENYPNNLASTGTVS